ncbi:hypothetical protein A1507_05675 [Methylomonas koyamae]|uniref:DUF3616 domain-containing protein n=1 Tax=Methylomonas koyamae TaxID=702114 RepID=A0A177NRA2_9GAMM|nr:DUF3616 domain-containing protein [Methylomonas koyamae]OAI19843.1 hypothetical protein A1507_05675 [Methylomonas koyamae]
MDRKNYQGSSNASGAVALDGNYFVVADDEENRLSVFEKGPEQALKPAIALSKVFDGEIENGKGLEIDLEGAAAIGNVYFWIGSHNTNKDGERRPSRHRLFALQIQRNAAGEFSGQRYGRIYRTLIDDLILDRRFKPYRLDNAVGIAPKALGGLSIEGLAATPKQSLLIGFRNPLAGGTEKNGLLQSGKALIVPLLNPLDLLQGQAAQFGDPIELDLGGYGIRDIAWRRDDEYLIVAGPYHANEDRSEKHRLYVWHSNHRTDKPTPLDVELGKLNIEAAFFFPGQTDRVELLSDDGDTEGFQCVSVKL